VEITRRAAVLTRENQDLFRAWVAHLREARPDLTETSLHVLAREYAIEGRSVPLRPSPPAFPKELRPGPLELLGLWKASRYLRRVKGILMAEIANAPSVFPTRKVGTVIAGLVGYVAYRYFAYEITPDVQETIAAVVVFVAAWLTRDRPNVSR
jgi:hypothetical protein